MSDYPGASWLARYRERVNGDPELDVIGDWFNTTLTLTFGDSRYALKIAKGKIADIIASPRLDMRAAFVDKRKLQPYAHRCNGERDTDRRVAAG